MFYFIFTFIFIFKFQTSINIMVVILHLFTFIPQLLQHRNWNFSPNLQRNEYSYHIQAVVLHPYVWLSAKVSFLGFFFPSCQPNVLFFVLFTRPCNMCYAQAWRKPPRPTQLLLELIVRLGMERGVPQRKWYVLFIFIYIWW